MSREVSTMRPTISILEDELKEKVFIEALEILEEIGVFIENDDALNLLRYRGVDIENQRAKIPQDTSKTVKSY